PARDRAGAAVAPAACRRRSHAGKPRSLGHSHARASTRSWLQRRLVTAVPWTLIPAPRITEHEVDAEPSLRAPSGSLSSACSHVGWRPAPRLRPSARGTDHRAREQLRDAVASDTGAGSVSDASAALARPER